MLWYFGSKFMAVSHGKRGEDLDHYGGDNMACHARR